MRRDIDGVFLDLIGRVVDDIEVTRERIALGVHRYEGKVNHRIPVQEDCVHDVILVVRNCQGRRDRRHEAVEEQIHIIVIDIDIGEDGFHIIFNRLRREDRFDTKDTLPIDRFFLTSRFALVVLMPDILTDRDRQRRINTCRIDIFLHELETLPETFLEVRCKVIERKRHPVVGVRLVMICGLYLE